jgi:hypothetical protein
MERITKNIYVGEKKATLNYDQRVILIMILDISNGPKSFDLVQKKKK